MFFWAVAISVGAVALAALLLVPGFRRDMAAARARLVAEAPRIADTACGPIEYAEGGAGPIVLVVHGIFGGFDQGLGIAAGNLGSGVRVIAPSRFGYLGTPMPADASPETQADAYACLLDHLGVARAVVFGTSAGATSALQFALRHPERTLGLILMSANAPGKVDVTPMPRPFAKIIFRSDALFWLLTTHLRRVLAPIMGVPSRFDPTPEQADSVAGVMSAILPVKPRADGALFDMYVSNPHINSGYAFDTLDTPVLIINARDDPLTLCANAAALASRLPEAELVTIEDGGHMLLGHAAEVQNAIAAFLDRVTRG